MEPVESWRRVFRDGFAPGLTDAHLAALAEACRTDDPRLMQGATTLPPPLMCVSDYEVEAGCILGFCGAVENGGFKGDPAPALVGQVEEFFARACFEADQRLGGPAECRWLLNWFDDAPRGEALRELLGEVEREQGRRRAALAA